MTAIANESALIFSEFSMRPVLLLAAALVVACGGDATGPAPSVTGQWSYTATNISGSGITCNISGVSLSLTQSGSTFTGSTTGGDAACSGPGGSFDDALGGDVIANGQMTGNAVQFDIGTQDVHNAGTLSGNSMSGTVTFRIATGTSTIILTGNFSAVRQ